MIPTTQKNKTSLPIDREKYKQAVLYFVAHCNNSYLGKTKLNKLLYYLDFISYRDRQNPVTGDSYRHLQYGPVPALVDEIISELKDAGSLAVTPVLYDNDSKKTFDFQQLKEPDTSAFDDYEANLLKQICQRFELWETNQIVDQTHLEAPWVYSQPYDLVDYELADDIDIIPRPN